MPDNIIERIERTVSNYLTLASLSAFSDGKTNSVYLLDTNMGKLVFKGNTSMYGSWKTEKEVDILFNLDKVIPVPKVIFHESVSEHFPGGYLITTVCEGVNPKRTFKALNNLFFENAAEVIGKAHQKIYKQFGFLRNYSIVGEDLRYLGGDKGPYANSFDQYISCIRSWENHLNERKSRYAPALRILLRRMEKCSFYFESQSPVFLHGDYSLKNIMHQTDTVTGVFDFEFAMAGDPSWDIHHFLIKSRQCGVLDDQLTSFKRSYDYQFGLPPNFYEKQNFMLYHDIFREIIYLKKSLEGREAEEQENIKNCLSIRLDELVRFIPTYQIKEAPDAY